MDQSVQCLVAEGSANHTLATVFLDGIFERQRTVVPVRPWLPQVEAALTSKPRTDHTLVRRLVHCQIGHAFHERHLVVVLVQQSLGILLGDVEGAGQLLPAHAIHDAEVHSLGFLA